MSITLLPKEILEIIYHYVDALSDRIALACTSPQLNAAATFSNLEHTVEKEYDVNIVKKHRAVDVVLKNATFLDAVCPLCKRLSILAQ